jgi:hypothetical protein
MAPTLGDACSAGYAGSQAIDTEGLSREALGLPATGLVLCSFNRLEKLDEATFRTWLQLLRRAGPDAVLWLFEPEGDPSATTCVGRARRLTVWAKDSQSSGGARRGDGRGPHGGSLDHLRSVAPFHPHANTWVAGVAGTAAAAAAAQVN